jgi:FkbM family methyltransferase
VLHQVQLRNTKVTVELDGDYYGQEFWEKVSSRKYEPDTVGFLEDRCGPNTDFMDIGAANGAMTLIAASSGARVSAYEPDPRIHRVVQQNIHLNSQLKSSVILQNKAISSTKGKLNFLNGEDSSVISSIVFTGHDASSSVEIDICQLDEEIEIFHQDKSRKLIVKMDIEGAEWKILKSDMTLESLRINETTLLLAVHPGFYRPFVPKVRGLDRIRLAIWQLRNYRESIEVFNKLEKYTTIQRTNLNPITRKHQFAALVLAGYHEFILEFTK